MRDFCNQGCVHLTAPDSLFLSLSLSCGGRFPPSCPPPVSPSSHTQTSASRVHTPTVSIGTNKQTLSEGKHLEYCSNESSSIFLRLKLFSLEFWINSVWQDVETLPYRCPFQHLPLSTRHHRTHFSGGGLRQVGAGRLICDAPLVVTATHVAHPRALAAAGTALWNRADGF